MEGQTPEAAESVDVRAARYAAIQMGLVTSGQAQQAGLTASAIRRRIESGKWVRMSRGLFVLSGAPRTWEQRIMALHLATGGVASHLSAARLHRLRFVPRDGDVEVTVPRGRSIRSPLGRVHVAGDAHLDAAMQVGPIPTTGVARTILDLGSAVGTARFARIVDDALDRHLVDMDALTDCLERHRGRGRRGTEALDRVLAVRGDGRMVTESAFERRFLAFCRQRGLPRPETQVVVRDDGRPIARCDALFRSARLVVELDGRRGHRQVTDRASDSVRDQRLLAIGWSTVRVTWTQLERDPDGLAATLSALMRTG